MPEIEVGNWVRYTEHFCQSTSTTDMGVSDMTRRRGKVVAIFGEGRYCNVDWGDHIIQFDVDSPSIEAAASPRGYDSDEPEPSAPRF